MSADENDIPSRFAVDFTGELLLGIYRVEAKLAEGGMGSVYKAEDTNLKRPVVVKVPHARFLGEAGFRGRFRREVTELVRLEHPNIVRILAQGEQDELPYHVLQYLGGGTLEQRIKGDTKTREAEDVVSWLRPIARTLDFIHARDVVHRDVKPDNILFDEAGHVFLSDFGVVKALQGDDLEATAMGTGIGSPQYMAPEQGLGKHVDGKADQYALATTVYEALTGQSPYDAKSTVELLIKKDREAPMDLGALRPDLPDAAIGAVMRAMSRDPEYRFESCKAFADTFATALALPTQTPALGSTVEIPPQPGSPKKALLILGLLVLLVGTLAYASGFFQGDKAAREAVEVVEEAGGPDLMLTLVDAGAEPRRALRYKPEAGATDKITLVVSNRQTVRLEGEVVPAPDQPDLRLFLDIHVDAVNDNGDVELTWYPRGGEVIPPAKSELPPDLVENLKAMFDEVKDRPGQVRISSRGIAYEGDNWDDGQGVGRLAKSLFANVRMGVRQLTAPFPAEAVGIGAIWDLKQSVTVFDIRMTQTTSYKIVSIEGDRITLDVGIAVAAPRQNIEKDGVTLRVERFFSSGDGKVIVDLGRIAPASNVSNTTVEAQMTQTKGDKSASIQVDVQTTNHLTRK